MERKESFSLYNIYTKWMRDFFSVSFKNLTDFLVYKKSLKMEQTEWLSRITLQLFCLHSWIIWIPIQNILTLQFNDRCTTRPQLVFHVWMRHRYLELIGICGYIMHSIFNYYLYVFEWFVLQLFLCGISHVFVSCYGFILIIRIYEKQWLSQIHLN